MGRRSNRQMMSVSEAKARLLACGREASEVKPASWNPLLLTAGMVLAGFLFAQQPRRRRGHQSEALKLLTKMVVQFGPALVPMLLDKLKTRHFHQPGPGPGAAEVGEHAPRNGLGRER